jgi:hypothetical protein
LWFVQAVSGAKLVRSEPALGSRPAMRFRYRVRSRNQPLELQLPLLTRSGHPGVAMYCLQDLNCDHVDKVVAETYSDEVDIFRDAPA